MNYAQVQAQIKGRLDNRNDLAQVIYDYSQGRIGYYQKFFFYSSDVVDTSISTDPGKIFYNLPNGIRSIRRLRLQLGSAQNNAVTPNTITTAQVTLPTSTIPVVSTTGFAATTGLLAIGGAQVYYATTDATDFTGCVGTGPGQTGTYPVGTPIHQLAGIWIDLVKRSYDYILNEDVLSPSLSASPPCDWTQIGLQFRIYPAPPTNFPLEITGNASPVAPVVDTDDNFWTEDAAWLIIACTANEVRKGYLHVEEVQADLNLEKTERHALMKVTTDLLDNTQIRAYY